MHCQCFRFTCVYVCMWVHVRTCMYIYICVLINVCVYMCVSTSCVCVCVCACVRVCVCMCTCVHITFIQHVKNDLYLTVCDNIIKVALLCWMSSVTVFYNIILYIQSTYYPT